MAGLFGLITQCCSHADTWTVDAALAFTDDRCIHANPIWYEAVHASGRSTNCTCTCTCSYTQYGSDCRILIIQSGSAECHANLAVQRIARPQHVHLTIRGYAFFQVYASRLTRHARERVWFW